MSGRIEQTVVVAVPVERAWEAFTDSEERSRWEAPEYEIDPRPGGKLRWTIPPHPAVDGEVLEVEPGRRLVTTESTGVLDGVTRVTVTFEDVGTGTRITVVQSGFGTGAAWQDALESHRQGWARALRDLVLYLETGVASRRFFSTWRSQLGLCLADGATGVRVTGVEPDSWAADAGLQPDDVVIFVDGLPIYDRTDLWPFQIARGAGEALDVVVARAGTQVRSRGVLRARA
jgi:uncharacterized protein YndB with AHSA1/START domain